MIDPSSCRSQEAAIWGRAGVVVQPGTHDLFVATSNGPFDGRTDWGDSVLRLSRGAGRLERHYTPANQRVLETTDADLGSAAPALLSRTLLLQGGKDGRLRLLDVRRSLHGVTGADGPRLGGEVQTLPLRRQRRPRLGHRGAAHPRLDPRLRRHRGRDDRVPAARRPAAAWPGPRASAPRARCSPAACCGPTTPPARCASCARPAAACCARCRRPPGTGTARSSPAGGVYLPSGDANDHRTAGTLSVYAPR